MLKKLFKRVTKKDESKKQITSKTIEEHREAVLAKGRKFKYPIQYAKNKLVINTIVISLVALALAGTFGWLQLYRFQNTSQLAYRVTEFLRLSVATIDGERVLYSDYLKQYRSSIRVIERQGGRISDDDSGRRQRNHYKRMALDNAIVNAYVSKLAREKDITISQRRIDDVLSTHLVSGDAQVTKSNFENLIRDNFGLSLSEYKRMFIELPLLRKDVSVRIDDNARETVQKLADQIRSDGSNFEELALDLGDRVVYESSSGLVGLLNQDGGRAVEASRLSVGQVSEPFLSRSGDSYYVIKLLNKTDDRVEYATIRVPLTELNRRIEQLRRDGKIREFISIPED